MQPDPCHMPEYLQFKEIKEFQKIKYLMQWAFFFPESFSFWVVDAIVTSVKLLLLHIANADTFLITALHLTHLSKPEYTCW